MGDLGQSGARANARCSDNQKTRAAAAALTVLVQRGVIRTWGGKDVEHMKAALKAAQNV